MQIPPPQVLPTFPQPNYIDPVTRGPELLIITIVFLPIVYIVVGLRTFSRLYLSKHFGIDDAFLLIALVPTTACAVIILLAQENWYWNRHVWDIPLYYLEFGLKMSMLLQCLFGLAVTFTKISLLILVMRVMSRGTGLLRYLSIAMIVIVACEGISFEVVVINNCSPISDYWKVTYSPQNCVNEFAFQFASAIINTCSDLFVFFLPIPTVFSLPIPFRQRFMLFLLFAAGLVVCGAGIARIYYIHATVTSYDRTWQSYPLWMASILNLYLGIICTALPATKPFFFTFLPSLFENINRSSTKSQHRLPTHVATSSKMNQSQVDLKQPEQFSIGDIPDPMAGGIEMTDDVKDSRQMLPLSYLSSQQSNRGSSYQSSNSPEFYHQSYHAYDTRDGELDEASGSHLGRDSARLTQQSDRTYRTTRASLSTSITEDHGSPHSPQSSQFVSSSMEVPFNFNQYGTGQEVRRSESQDVLIPARPGV